MSRPGLLALALLAACAAARAADGGEPLAFVTNQGDDTLQILGQPQVRLVDGC